MMVEVIWRDDSCAVWLIILSTCSLLPISEFIFLCSFVILESILWSLSPEIKYDPISRCSAPINLLL